MRFKNNDDDQVSFKSFMGHSALHWAACFALYNICLKLIHEGADINGFTLFGSPLRFAMIGGNCRFSDEQCFNFSDFVFVDEEFDNIPRENVIRQLLAAGASYISHSWSPHQCTLPEAAVARGQSSDRSLGICIILDFGNRLSNIQISNHACYLHSRNRADGDRFRWAEFWKIGYRGSSVTFGGRARYLLMHRISSAPGKYCRSRSTKSFIF